VRAGAPAGWRLQAHERLASTQDTAIEAAKSGDPGHLAILAAEQTNGRGSRGRAWQGATGNLHLSALVRPQNLPPQPGFWALMAGVSLHEAVSPHVADASRLLLKWPNDLLLDGAKLGGILIDSAVTAHGMLDWVVIGIGVNLHEAPGIEGRATASLAGTHIESVAVAQDILANFDCWISEPLPTLRDAWLDRAQPIGTWLTITTGTHTSAGAFAGLAEDGGLLLSGHQEPITTGEVFAAQGVCRAGGIDAAGR
jgi:BirA family biotin operon repressor/biotin-[acetyl-CoA-carboxylase] ligase